MSKRPRKQPAPKAPAVIRNAPWAECVQIGPHTLYLGDCTEVMAALDDASVHACVTDPPYELGFMGKAWDKADGVASDPATWAHVLRLLTPGGHLVAFAGSRTYHRIAMAIERSGFDVRDQLLWLYGSGFPKSHDIAKCIDKRGGVHRGKAGAAIQGDAKRSMGQHYQRTPKGEAVFDDAKQWDGWGTALKPAHEPIALARKPFRGAVTDNVLAHGTGALNIDASRVGWTGEADAAAAAAAAAAARVTRDTPGRERWAGHGGGAFNDPAASLAGWQEKADLGRWPANVLTDGSLEVLEAFPSAAREAIRFFYAAKASKDEREFGLQDHVKTRRAGTFGDGIDASPKINGERPAARANIHPTVKPINLMAWLCRLVTPPGGTVLEPFMGSGSTGIAAVRHGFRFVGIEQSPEYFEIAKRRITAAVDQETAMPTLELEITRAVRALQLDLLSGDMEKK